MNDLQKILPGTLEMGKTPPPPLPPQQFSELREKKLIVRGGEYFECRGVVAWDGSAFAERVK